MWVCSVYICVHTEARGQCQGFVPVTLLLFIFNLFYFEDLVHEYNTFWSYLPFTPSPPFEIPLTKPYSQIHVLVFYWIWNLLSPVIYMGVELPTVTQVTYPLPCPWRRLTLPFPVDVDFLELRSSHLVWGPQMQLACLATEPQRSSHLHRSGTRIRGVRCHAWQSFNSGAWNQAQTLG